jgi:hypothetical protein
LAEAIRDLTTLYNSRGWGQGWAMVSGMLPLAVYRDDKRRMNAAGQRQARFGRAR